MSQHSEKLNLSKGGLPHNFIVLTFFEFFYGNYFTTFLISASKHDAVCPFSNYTQYFVFVHLDPSKRYKLSYAQITDGVPIFLFIYK
mmetsp:Transcript_46750/g.124164  ORF Transcript_46750/g.124164 Transcript_46750/m.124164 type:complete len:87 (+) Transcript_46750:959-1219(+)